MHIPVARSGESTHAAWKQAQCASRDAQGPDAEIKLRNVQHVRPCEATAADRMLMTGFMFDRKRLFRPSRMRPLFGLLLLATRLSKRFKPVWICASFTRRICARAHTHMLLSVVRQR